MTNGMDSYQEVDSYQYLKLHLRILHAIGIYFPQNYRVPFLMWSIFINTVVTIYYPVSLVIGFFMLTKTQDILENLSLIFTIIACSLKIVIFGLRRRDMLRIQVIVKHLDRKIKSDDEKFYISKTKKSIKIINLSYAILYVFILLTSAVGMFFYTERRLLYPAWFPLDWKSSTFTYNMVLIYQYVGLCIQGSQNFTTDSAPPALLCLLSGHIHVLAIRMQKIGMDSSRTQKEVQKDLIECILDHKMSLGFYKALHSVLSPGTFIQMLVTAFNICITIVTMLFVANGLIQQVYFGAYIIAIPMQIYLACYYGSVVNQESQNLTSALYFSTWVDQSPTFKKHMITCMERTKKPIIFVAAGVAKISLETFFSIMKSAFSLFAVLIRMKP